MASTVVVRERSRHVGAAVAGDKTHLKCSRNGVRASFQKCSRNAGHRVGAAVCLADGSKIVDECTPRNHEEACHRVWAGGQES